jgi:membrane protease YdiL (CAAX protease family)
LVLIGAYPLVVGILGWDRSPANGPALGHGARALLLVSFFELLIFAVVFGLAWLASRASRDDLLLRWRGGWLPVPLGIGYSIALRLLVALVAIVVVLFMLLTRLATPDGLQQFALAKRPDVGAIVDISALSHNPLYFWLTVTLVSFVLGGLREELWRSAVLAGMRSLWPQRFGSRAGQLFAVALAAIVFGLGHLVQGPIAVGLTAVLGFGLGAIMVLHRSIWPAVIAHGMFDATSLALLPWVLEKLPQLR